jgi:hypothetical protein
MSLFARRSTPSKDDVEISTQATLFPSFLVGRGPLCAAIVPLNSCQRTLSIGLRRCYASPRPTGLVPQSQDARIGRSHSILRFLVIHDCRRQAVMVWVLECVFVPTGLHRASLCEHSNLLSFCTKPGVTNSHHPGCHQSDPHLRRLHGLLTASGSSLIAGIAR